MRISFFWKHGVMLAILATVLLWRFDAAIAAVLFVAVLCGAYAALRLSPRGKRN